MNAIVHNKFGDDSAQINAWDRASRVESTPQRKLKTTRRHNPRTAGWKDKR